MNHAAAFTNAMRLQVQRAIAGRQTQRYGEVTAYNPNNYTARVKLQPEQITTGWLPIACAWAGNGWGMFAPPIIGQQVAVGFFDGSLNAGFVDCYFPNNVERNLATPSGEFWLVHKKGAFFKLTNDGKLTFTDGHGATIALDGAGNIVSQATQWTHTGPVHFTDNVQVDKTLTATTDVIGGGKSLKTHVHGGVSSGGSNTGPPA